MGEEWDQGGMDDPEVTEHLPGSSVSVVQHIPEPCSQMSRWETGHVCIHPLTIHVPLHLASITEIYSVPSLMIQR